uniref:Tudor domain-containing protein n=1 Tax=Timema bartmani TaxID=61472 RepID=A0A7R9I3V5_9NEOP|nr:unnamed protein product [Timema bartmani]
MLDDTYTNSTIISPLTPLRARLLASSKKQSPTLQVNNFRNPTLPMECKSSCEVLQIAAKQPFEDFRKLPQTLRNSMSDHSIKEFVDDQSIITMNIITLLNSFPSGIWAENLPHFYTKTFGETLPENWGLVIKVNPRINIEEPVPGKSIIFLSTEISPKSLSSNLDEISLQQVVPPPLILPETAEWDIYITVVTPDVNIYVRLLGEDYSIIYDNMATDMELYYMNTIAVVDNPIVGNYYAIKLDDCWHRVCVQEIQEQQEGRLFFIDQGDEEWHPLSSLCHLEPKFAQIPAQDIFSLTSLTATLPLFLTSAATWPKLEPGGMVLNGEGKRGMEGGRGVYYPENTIYTMGVGTPRLLIAQICHHPLGLSHAIDPTISNSHHPLGLSHAIDPTISNSHHPLGLSHAIDPTISNSHHPLGLSHAIDPTISNSHHPLGLSHAIDPTISNSHHPLGLSHAIDPTISNSHHPLGLSHAIDPTISNSHHPLGLSHAIDPTISNSHHPLGLSHAIDPTISNSHHPLGLSHAIDPACFAGSLK